LKNVHTGCSIVLSRFGVGMSEKYCIDEVGKELKNILVLREH